MILLVGDPLDDTSVYLGWLVEIRGWEIAVLAEDQFGLEWTLERDPGDGSVRTVVVHGRRIAWKDVDGAVVRLGSTPAVHPTIGVVPNLRRVYATARRAEIEQLFTDAPFTVVNRPVPGASHDDPECTLARLRDCGFRVPDSVMTDDAALAQAFADRHGWNVLAKSTPGFRPFVGWWRPDMNERLESAPAPVLLQEYIAGDDVTVVIVGGAAFATLVASDRFGPEIALEAQSHHAVEVPAVIRQLCLIQARCLDLSLASFRFRVTIDGTWWCHRMDADPEIVQFEIGAGHRIGEAILDLIGPAPADGVEPVSVHEPRHATPIAALSELAFA